MSDAYAAAVSHATRIKQAEAAFPLEHYVKLHRRLQAALRHSEIPFIPSRLEAKTTQAEEWVKQIYELLSTKQFVNALALQRRLLNEDANISEQLVEAKIDALFGNFEHRPDQSLEKSYAREKKTLQSNYDFSYLLAAIVRNELRARDQRMDAVSFSILTVLRE